MRVGQRILLTLGTLVTVLATAVVPAPQSVGAATGSTTSSADALRARRAELVQQLGTIQGERSDALAQLRAAEGQLSSVETTLAATRNDLDAADAHLQRLSSQIASHEHGLAADRAELTALLRATYESSGNDGFAGAVLGANDFGQAMDRIRGAQHITTRLQELQTQVADSERALLDERSQVRSAFSRAQSLEDTLGQQQSRLLVAVGQRDQAFAALSGPARDLASQIAQIDDQLAPKVVAVPAAPTAAPTGPSGPVAASSTCGNRFAYGNCTYYVATRRCIPWLGNAYQWWGNARAAGYSEGQVPQRGAVAVWGQMGSSPVGHVAYVEAVGPDKGVPAGSFMISEMNYSGWNRVDYRVVRIGAAGLLGFIYGKA